MHNIAKFLSEERHEQSTVLLLFELCFKHKNMLSSLMIENIIEQN